MKINRDLIKNILEEKLKEKTQLELDEVGRPPIYSNEDIKTIACAYETRRDFMQNDKKIFFAAKNRKLLDDLSQTCNWKTLGNKYMRMIYMITWPYPNSAVYVGLTCDIDKRTQQHASACHMDFDKERTKDTKKKDRYIKEFGMGKMTPLTDYISSDGASCLEKAFIHKLRKLEKEYDYFKVLNSERSTGGELGHCRADARDINADFNNIIKLKIRTDKDLELKLPDVYDFYKDSKSRQSALNRKYTTSKHDVLFPNARKETLYLLNRIKNYDSKEDFKKERYEDFKSAVKQLKLPLIFPEPNYYINLSNDKEYKNLKEVSDDLNVPFDILYQSLLTNRGKEEHNIINSNEKEQITEQKNIIKKILSEEVNEQLIFKGINILVNSLKQEYPYILGWELMDSLDEYKSTIYINLVVSYDDVEEFYGLKPRYEKFMYIGKHLATPMSPFRARYDNEGIEEASKMNDYIEGMYEYIPNEMKMPTSFDEPNNYYKDYYKVVKIDNYIFVDERTN